MDACAYLTHCDKYNSEKSISREESYEKWLSLADSNNALAMFYLGTNPPDSKKQYSFYKNPAWLSKSCELGYSRACRELTLYYEQTEPNEQERIKFLEKSVKNGDLRSNFDLSLLSLEQLMINPSQPNFQKFQEQFEYTKYSWFTEERTYFKIGEVLFNSENKAFYELGVKVIILSSNRLEDAEEFLIENHINKSEYTALSNYDEFDTKILSALENFCVAE